jgi:hypothetical protein
MVTRISSITPLQLGVVYGVLYALLGFIFGVVFAIASLAGSSGPMPGIGGFGWLSIIVFPIVYGVIGFIAGIILALLYNLVAGWTGGVELTFSTPVSTSVTTTP